MKNFKLLSLLSATLFMAAFVCAPFTSAQAATLQCPSANHQYVTQGGGAHTSNASGIVTSIGGRDIVDMISNGCSLFAGTQISAAADPGVNDDTTLGFVLGSNWVNVASGAVWTAVDVTDGAAVWTLAGSSVHQGTTLTAGASGTAGNVKIYPTTAAKGYLNITVTDQTGNTAVTLNAAAMGQATTLTIPDPGAGTASLVLTGGTQTVGGAKTFSTSIKVGGAGTSLSQAVVASDTVASGQTSKTVTVTGATASSKCVATANEVPTNAVYIKSAAPGTDQVVVTVSADPGASNLDLTVICIN